MLLAGYVHYPNSFARGSHCFIVLVYVVRRATGWASGMRLSWRELGV